MYRGRLVLGALALTLVLSVANVEAKGFLGIGDDKPGAFGLFDGKKGTWGVNDDKQGVFGVADGKPGTWGINDGKQGALGIDEAEDRPVYRKSRSTARSRAAARRRARARAAARD